MPDNCIRPTRVEPTTRLSIRPGSQDRSLFDNMATRIKVVAGTINDAAALTVASGTIDKGRHGCGWPVSVATCPNRSRPGNACQTAGGNGTSCNKARMVAAHNINIIARPFPDAENAFGVRGQNRTAMINIAAAAARTTICPGASAREAPPANQRIAIRAQNRIKERLGPKPGLE